MCNHEFQVKANYNGFFGCTNAHFSRFNKSYYIVPQMKHEEDNKKIQVIKVHYELISQHQILLRTLKHNFTKHEVFNLLEVLR